MNIIGLFEFRIKLEREINLQVWRASTLMTQVVLNYSSGEFQHYELMYTLGMKWG